MNAAIKNGKVAALGSHPTFFYIAQEIHSGEKS